MGDDQRAERCILDIPSGVMLGIIRSLDADGGWRQLAALTGCFTVLHVERLYRKESPGHALMLDLGRGHNSTVRQLHGYLLQLRRSLEVAMLEEYANL